MTQHTGDTINKLAEAVKRAEQRSKIITSFDYPPIPIRAYDWSAYRDGYEPGEPLGHGETEQAAVANLLEIEEEEASSSGQSEHLTYNECLYCGEPVEAPRLYCSEEHAEGRRMDT